MKVFISWSGRRSHEVAQALGPWLSSVIQSVDCWISSDMERGVKWIAEIGKSLDSHSFGVLAVTPGNKARPWLCFEAGALSKHLGDDGRVVPYLLDFKSPADLGDPLGQFNAALADREGTWQLVKTLNSHTENSLPDENLKKTFDLWWPDLETDLERIRASVTPRPLQQRSQEEKIDEILKILRGNERYDASARRNSPASVFYSSPFADAEVELSPSHLAFEHDVHQLVQNVFSPDVSISRITWRNSFEPYIYVKQALRTSQDLQNRIEEIAAKYRFTPSIRRRAPRRSPAADRELANKTNPESTS